MIEKMLTKFASEEKGSVTVDWIVLTAGLIGLSIAILATVGSASSNVATRTSDAVAIMETIQS